MKKHTILTRALCALICTLCVLASLFGCSPVDTTDNNAATAATDNSQSAQTDTAVSPSDGIPTPEDTLPPAQTTEPVTTQTAPVTTQTTPSGDCFITTPTGIDIPAYSGEAYIPLLGNVPLITSDDWTTSSFETYGELDSLGRCTTVYACIGRDLMPTEERGSIGMVKPSGWQTAKYDFVDGKYLYNRCHLIGWQLTGENANTKNLITGTRYLNIEGMLPFENMVADYIKETNNHVLYRVTPLFSGDELVARGVLMEGWSVEDNGEGICFFVFAYNVQPGVKINYADGSNEAAEAVETTPVTAAESEGANTAPVSTADTEQETEPSAPITTYILNTNTKKFHYSSCRSVKQMSDKNKSTFTGTRDEIISRGYDPCGVCHP